MNESGEKRKEKGQVKLETIVRKRWRFLLTIACSKTPSKNCNISSCKFVFAIVQMFSSYSLRIVVKWLIHFWKLGFSSQTKLIQSGAYDVNLTNCNIALGRKKHWTFLQTAKNPSLHSLYVHLSVYLSVWLCVWPIISL